MPALTQASQNGIELLGAERPGAAHARHRRRANQDGLGSALQTPLEFFERTVDDAEVDHRGGEDPVLVGELPGFVHPLVQRVHDVKDQLGIVLQSLLDEAGQRREHQRVVQAESVHHLQPRRGVAEGGDGLHGLAHHLAKALAAAAVPEVFLLGAGPGDHLERRVRDVVADDVSHHDLGAAPDLDVVDDALAAIRQELRQRLFGLVEVVVRVEHRIGKLA